MEMKPLHFGEAIEEHHAGPAEHYLQWGKLKRMNLGV